MNRTINPGDTEIRRLSNFSVRSVSLWRKRFLFWLLPLAFLILLFFYPLSRIFALTLKSSALTFENLQIAWSALRFTFYQAALSTLHTLLLGLPAAYVFARYDFRGGQA